ncbi:MAG: enoyl-CoA hydratase-related protein, partial [Ginsengibacter sp.]
MYKTLATELENGIFTITINRPDKLNALNKTVFEDLDQLMDDVYANDQIKGVIITGAGPKAFVAGADISEFLQISNEDAEYLSSNGQRIFFKIEDSPKPVIAAVNGFALGGGCELAMACHFRIAANNARFGQPEVNLGLIPGYGGTQRLSMLVGKGKAMELILTGNMIGAEEAQQLGLVNQVTTPEELMDKTKEILSLILTKSPVGVAKAIKAINSFNHSLDGYKKEATIFAEAFASEDKNEGTAAFLE